MCMRKQKATDKTKRRRKITIKVQHEVNQLVDSDCLRELLVHFRRGDGLLARTCHGDVYTASWQVFSMRFSYTGWRGRFISIRF